MKNSPMTTNEHLPLQTQQVSAQGGTELGLGKRRMGSRYKVFRLREGVERRREKVAKTQAKGVTVRLLLIALALSGCSAKNPYVKDFEIPEDLTEMLAWQMLDDIRREVKGLKEQKP